MKISNRRKFIKYCAASCLGCALLSDVKLLSNGIILNGKDDEVPDPKKLEYCGYKCPDDCKFLQATLKNDNELKKEAYELWDIKNKYGVSFDSDTIFCYTCKNEDKPDGVVVSNCTVRQCVIEKELDCCIECTELIHCEKDLWKKFPNFHKMVIDMQKKYSTAKT